MKTHWISLGDGGMLRADAVLFLFRSDVSPADGEVPTLVTLKHHALRMASTSQSIEEVVVTFRKAGVSMLQCRRRRLFDMPDHWHDVWLNLDRVLYVLYRGATSQVFFDDLEQANPMEIVSPSPEELMSALRYSSAMRAIAEDQG